PASRSIAATIGSGWGGSQLSGICPPYWPRPVVPIRGGSVMAVPLRRLAAVCLTALILPATALAAGSVHSWAQPQIKLVTRQGIFADTPATFHPDDPLTQGALAAALAKLTAAAPATPTDSEAPVSLEELDR